MPVAPEMVISGFIISVGALSSIATGIPTLDAAGRFVEFGFFEKL
jgi:hypothetical protein